MLATARSLYQYHTGTMTGMVEGLNTLFGNELVEMNPKDAFNLGINDMGAVKVISRRSKPGLN